jgi:hypothetical protein
LIVFVYATAMTNTKAVEATWKHKAIARSTQQEECLAENTIVFCKFI